MNCSRVNPQGHTLYKIALGLLMAVFIGGCKAPPPEPREPPCTQAGYFKSTDRVGGFYRCVYDKEIQRWIQYPFTCPVGLEFDERVTACVRP